MLKQLFAKFHFPLNSFLSRTRKHCCQVMIAAKHESNSPVAFITHKLYIAVLFLTLPDSICSESQSLCSYKYGVPQNNCPRMRNVQLLVHVCCLKTSLLELPNIVKPMPVRIVMGRTFWFSWLSACLE